ncbi:MAG: sulfatase-like hydrolase/transferase [Verrucomicrobiales bacterium]|nr:sulfatase-like hydrolase/transferase [Verrucomicrobiales bacterium]
MKTFLCLIAMGLTLTYLPQAFAGPNLLLITVDDMSADSVGAFGAGLANTTPHIDRLASEGLCFDLAHVQVGNCYPSRNIMWSGRYPHNSGVEGFYEVKPIHFPTLCDVLQKAGYWVGIRGKVSHSTPFQPFHWDADLTIGEDGQKAHLKDVESYGASTRRGIEAAAAAGKPFCINVNISDPHKPFWSASDGHPASRVFTPDEVPVPGFLPDDPAIREELALYYTSVRRADDCVGSILHALEESGRADETFVLFLSDHGMPLPFAKTQLYHHSTHTPLIVRWPGVTKAGTRNDTHLVSAVDFLATLCDVVRAEKPANMDGTSFEPLLHGNQQKNRNAIFKAYYENAGGNRHPMRGVQSKRYLYLFNPWSDGENQFKTATQGTVSYKRLQSIAETDPEIAARLELFDHRVLEEFYDIESDPDCLHNLTGSPDHAQALQRHRTLMKSFMEESKDPMLDTFLNRGNEAVRKAFMQEQQAQADERRIQRRRNKQRKQKAERSRKGNQQ